ncbi:lysophospholipase-like protein 1 [Spodoptera frugiperda]|uniref:palmitoyl-protein hydrolase n=1 Tax=Spodoptera frugiperda TaxID=7108 RepID=A0A9R0EGN1_SPOFR|nr:lysophospholipase-like protein 1 [Spodoptera frugiperda]XP_035433037.1 lysophospholipase-like protein 1 [Spodoptera frugiperda]XP_035433044.1 lysophospholipase-like protein 1 [Spodoptera frugiperda]XP_050560555.1 lysophospholipase-like protein 1 [Spodoptera frugiperda]
MSRLGALHLTQSTGQKHTGTVIFFHGSGSSGADIKEWVRLMVANFSFPQIKVLYPTAPLQPYSPVGGQMSKVWFDRACISPNVPEKLESITQIEAEVKNLIKKENDAGIPSNRIIIGGFSMGGALALHTAYRWDRNLAATFAFSSFLNDNSVVYDEVKQVKGTKLPPLLQIHGDNDDLVDLSWAKETFNLLKEHGVQGEFHIMERLGHSLNKRGVRLIKDWIEKNLPEI